MGLEEVVQYGEEILRAKAKPVDPLEPGLQELIDRMYVVMKESEGLGLAANQIGIQKQVFVYETTDGPSALLNPKITRRKGSQEGVEGCLSIPGLQGDVKRANNVVVEGLDREGNKVQLKAEGLLARVFQHEIDHLNGTLFIDRADPDTLGWVTVEDEEE